MPPKKKQNDKNNKQQQKKKSKEAEDKTFGLKNKNKSKKVQNYVKQVQAQTVDKKKEEAMAKKKAAERAAAERAKKEALILGAAPVIEQKVPFGTDPKSVLCLNYKEGKCLKGDRCKFSHDMNIGRKAAKIDLYTDSRKTKEEDKMDDWDEDKLRSVVKSKQGNNKTTTNIVCKYFIQAVENGKYGWFWVCPNGGNECKYQHALPEGFVLKTKEQRRLEQLAADSAPKFTLEDFIELEKGKLSKNLTPISADSFAKWKKEHQLKKTNEKNKLKAGKKILTGREVVEQKYKNKLLVEGSKTASGISAAEDEEEGTENGTAWDLSEFTKALKEEDAMENIKDYGDGTNIESFDAEEEALGTASTPNAQTEIPQEKTAAT